MSIVLLLVFFSIFGGFVRVWVVFFGFFVFFIGFFWFVVCIWVNYWSKCEFGV